MAYIDQANLALESDFIRRVSSALSEQAQYKGDNLSGMVLKDPLLGASVFMPFISTLPGFGDAYANSGQEGITDGMLLSGIQAVWDKVSALYPVTS